MITVGHASVGVRNVRQPNSWVWNYETLPLKPYCANDLEYGLKIRSREHAVECRYLQINLPQLVSWLLLDVDRPGAADCWMDAALPEPTWTCMNPANGHAHICWQLASPVWIGSPEHQHPARYLAAIEGAFIDRTSADAAYGGLITKNPGNSSWITSYRRDRCYDLHELAEYVDLSRSSTRQLRASSGIGRNVTLFDSLRRWAYQHVGHWRKHACFDAWSRELRSIATEMNGFSSPLFERELAHVAKSVATWVWNHYRGRLTDEQFASRQASRARKKGLTKRLQGLQMLKGGHDIVSVAGALDVSPRTVRNWRRNL